MAPTPTIREFMVLTDLLLERFANDTKKANSVRELRVLALEDLDGMPEIYERLLAIEARYQARDDRLRLDAAIAASLASGSGDHSEIVSSSDEELQTAIRRSMQENNGEGQDQSSDAGCATDTSDEDVDGSHALSLAVAREQKKKRMSVESRLPSPEVEISDDVVNFADEFETLAAFIRARTPADHGIYEQLRQAELRVAADPSLLSEEVEMLRAPVLSLQDDEMNDGEDTSIHNRLRAAADRLRAMVDPASAEARWLDGAVSIGLSAAHMEQTLQLIEAIIEKKFAGRYTRFFQATRWRRQ